MSEAPEAPVVVTPTVTDAPAPSVDAVAPASEGAQVAASATPQQDEPISPAAAPTEGDSETEASVQGGAAPDAVELKAEDYDFTLPEGFTTDDALVQNAREAFAANGIPKDAAQPLVDLFASVLAKQNETAVSAFNEQQGKWKSEIDAMQEFQGQTREKSLASIGRLWDTYGSAEAKEAMNSYGIGNNPHLARMFAKMAEALNEGTVTPASRPAPNGKDGAPQKGRLSYPNTPQINQGN